MLIMKVLCTIAFSAPTGEYTTGYEFPMARNGIGYTISYSMADLTFTIKDVNGDYEMRSSLGVCTVTKQKEKK